MKTKLLWLSVFLLLVWRVSAFAQTALISADSDQDGLSDEEETQLHTDSKVCDTDGDGLGDGLEAGKIFPEATTAACRGLSAAGSNFLTPSFLDPLSTDSDNDALKDGEEDANHNGWLDFNETDPTSADTDEDGLSDNFEKTLGQKKEGLPFDLQSLSNGEGCSPPADKSDVDCDGLVNARDEDSDNDGCLDGEEEKGDMDQDGILDVWEQQVKNCAVSGSTSSSGNSSAQPSSSAAPSESPASGGVDKQLSREAVASKGGGACQLNPVSKGDAISSFKLWLILILFVLNVRGIVRKGSTREIF